MLVREHQFGFRRFAGTGKTVSHATLFSRPQARTSPSSHIDAVLVPGSRGASALRGAAHLSVRLRVPMAVLCSRETRAAEAAAFLDQWLSGCSALLIDVPTGYDHDVLPHETSSARFREASAFRDPDLGLKRNLGLLLARLLGWGKVLFLDDDIGHSAHGAPALPVRTVRRLAAELDVRQIAGLTCHDYPDNSVVCHARRLAGLPQGNLISGAALGVNCNDHPLPFFPDHYNEDWFFFSRLAAERNLVCVGEAPQDVYDPFASPVRARKEEFGDLLAEGLYSLFATQETEMDYSRRLDAADAAYWEQFISHRSAEVQAASARLTSALNRDGSDADRKVAALRCLDAAGDQLSVLSPELCVAFLEAWQADLESWGQASQRISAVHDVPEAMDCLSLRQWFSLNIARTTTTDPNAGTIVV